MTAKSWRVGDFNSISEKRNGCTVFIALLKVIHDGDDKLKLMLFFEKKGTFECSDNLERKKARMFFFSTKICRTFSKLSN